MIPDECPVGPLRGASTTDTSTMRTPPRCRYGGGGGGGGPPAAAGGGVGGVGGLLADIKTPIVKEPFTDHYSILPGRELGRGKFAVVRKCVERSTGREYAAKFMRKRRKGQDCRPEIVHEVALLELASDSQRVVNLHQVYEMASEMVLVLEYAAGGEIYFQCVAERGEEEEAALSQTEVKRLMRQILEGVAFLHRHHVVHLDLKPQNILLTSDSPVGDIKIVDFGLSRMVNSHKELREIMGTPEYVAPEILDYEPISTATDMWSIGVLAYVMLTGVSPFLGDNKQETFLNISQLNVSYSEEELQHVERSALDFIKALLRKKPQERSTAEQCLHHPWLQDQGQPSTTTTSITSTSTLELQEAAAASSEESRKEDNHHHNGGEEREGGEEEEVEEEVHQEELMVMASYTLHSGQCRQTSSSSEKGVLAAAVQAAAVASSGVHQQQKKKAAAISKRFKFEEPFMGTLQEILPPAGEFIC